MKNGIFGKLNDTPIKKLDEKNISDDIELDLGEDSVNSSDLDNVNKIQDESDKKLNKDNNDYYSSDSDKDKSDSKEENNPKEETNPEEKDSKKQIEDMLINSIKNKENATSEKIQMAEEINFGSIPDKLISTDEYGFIIEKKPEQKPKEKQADLLKVNARMEKWNFMVENIDEFKTKKFDKLKSRTRKGIPDNLRSYVWQIFAEKNRYYQKGLFKKLDSKPVKEDLETVIIKDLDRTYPNCQLFKDKYGNGQRKLYKVLANYSKYNTSTGYVQGMGFIAAVFLTYMDEESSFYMLHSLMKKYELEGFYLPGFPELKKTFYILLNLEKKFVPKIYELFKKEGMMPSMYASEWFICLFSRNLDFHTLVRIFDVFLLEGYKVIYRFALALLKSKENEFLKGKDGLVSIMATLNKSMENTDVENLFRIAFGFSLSRKDLDKLGNEFNKVKNEKNNEFVKQL